jgi:uncharacterized protein YxeA
MNLKLSESEDLRYIRKKTTFLVPPFPFVKEDKDKEEKPKATDVIEFLLKRELTVYTASTKKIKVKGFANSELWRQNGITVMLDKRSDITSILLGIR